MNTTSHTPGPWSLSHTRFPDHRDGFTVLGNDARGNRNIPVAQVPEWFFQNLGTKDQHAANAKLLAASPALLAALQAIDAAYDSSAAHGHPVASPLYSAIMDARRLLAVNGWTNPQSRSEILAR